MKFSKGFNPRKVPLLAHEPFRVLFYRGIQKGSCASEAGVYGS